MTAPNTISEGTVWTVHTGRRLRLQFHSFSERTPTKAPHKWAINIFRASLENFRPHLSSPSTLSAASCRSPFAHRDPTPASRTLRKWQTQRNSAPSANPKDFRSPSHGASAARRRNSAPDQDQAGVQFGPSPPARQTSVQFRTLPPHHRRGRRGLASTGRRSRPPPTRQAGRELRARSVLPVQPQGGYQPPRAATKPIATKPVGTKPPAAKPAAATTKTKPSTNTSVSSGTKRKLDDTFHHQAPRKS